METLTTCCMPASAGSIAPTSLQERLAVQGRRLAPIAAEWTCAAAGVASLEQTHHHIPEWEQGLLDQLHLQDGAAAQEAHGHIGQK